MPAVRETAWRLLLKTLPCHLRWHRKASKLYVTGLGAVAGFSFPTGTLAPVWNINWRWEESGRATAQERGNAGGPASAEISGRFRGKERSERLGLTHPAGTREGKLGIRRAGYTTTSSSENGAQQVAPTHSPIKPGLQGQDQQVASWRHEESEQLKWK